MTMSMDEIIEQASKDLEKLGEKQDKEIIQNELSQLLSALDISIPKEKKDNTILKRLKTLIKGQRR